MGEPWCTLAPRARPSCQPGGSVQLTPAHLARRYQGGGVCIIDVSQSVEHDHPHALEFLRKDCANVNGEWTLGLSPNLFAPVLFTLVNR